MADFIEDVTGHRPATCPWRVFYDPFVREILKGADYAADGNLVVAWGDDPPAEWVDALHVYRTAKNATKAHFMEKDRKAREAKRKG